MKKNLLLVVGLLLFLFISAQAQEGMPQAMNYQAIARDAAGKVLSEKQIGVKVEILKGSATGNVVFAETHTPRSSKTGTINLMVGNGTSLSGSFSGIDWASGVYFLQLSMDTKGGTNYEKVSTTQMLPVPYALYAAKAGVAENGGGSGDGGSSIAPFVLIANDEDTDPEELYSIIAGNTITEGSDMDGTSDFTLSFSIVYLNGLDQELSAQLESLDGTYPPYNDKYDEYEMMISPSTPMGRSYFRLGFSKVPRGVHAFKLVIKDKKGNALKTYPFKVNVTE